MIIRRARPEDTVLLAKHRAAVWAEVDDWDPAELASMIPVWAAFFEARLDDRTYTAFVAEEHERVLGSGGLLMHTAIPRPGSRSEQAGRVQSVYVVPDARRRGIARAIVQRLLDAAQDNGLISVMLHPSEHGRPLYSALGFRVADEMQLRFTDR